MRNVVALLVACWMVCGAQGADGDGCADRAVVVSAPQVLTVSPYAASTPDPMTQNAPAETGWRAVHRDAAPVVSTRKAGEGAADVTPSLLSDDGSTAAPMQNRFGAAGTRVPVPGPLRLPPPPAEARTSNGAMASFVVPPPPASVYGGADRPRSPFGDTFPPTTTLAPWAGPVIYPPPVVTYRPVTPAASPPAEYQLGRGVFGQPTLYLPGQPIRNFLRSLTP